jgi:hypothetical protein
VLPTAAIGERGRLLGLGIVALVGAAMDLGVAGLGLPTIRRQVNERWLYVYRGWYYGLGFGLQLGVGFVTVVNSSALYLSYVAAFLSNSSAAGAAIGACFGLLRGLSLAATAGITSPTELFRVTHRLMSLNRTAGGLASMTVLLLGGACAFLALWQ